jgi:transcriptional regulator with XRE-family HTH domain
MDQTPKEVEVMATRTSPTVRRRRLAAEMRRLRKESGRGREEAATAGGIAPATLSRIEAGSHAPSPGAIALLCKFYGVSEEHTDALVALARESRKRGWWQKYGEGIPDWFEVYVGLEEEAAEVRSYQPVSIYGLLQTEAYAKAVLTVDRTVGEQEGARRVEVRLKRQELLEGTDSPALWTIMDEAVLRREIGGRPVMREQLEHLLVISRLAGVMVQVIPNAAGAHASMDSAFTIIGFPDRRDPDVAYVQYRRGSIYLEEPAEVDDYDQLFNQLRAKALGFEESRALIAQIINEMT